METTNSDDRAIAPPAMPDVPLALAPPVTVRDSVVRAAADTTAMNGRRYHQRYNFFLRFEGDLIAEGREYNDTNLVREVFLT